MMEVMTQADLYAYTAAVLFGIGVFGFLTRPQLLRRLVALNLMGSAVFLLLVAFARRGPDVVDPVPHAMVLTGIVVAVSTTAFGLALARRFYRMTGRLMLGEDENR
jgi:multicomponent Na+:H+ antiporter subunit C